MDPYELAIINTPMFQRMHNIKQLSLGYYVYHGTDHSRFGHMLGAMHLAGRAYDSIKENSKNFGEFDEDPIDRKTIRMAALLHDVGHAPFSHSLENLLDEPHETYTQYLIDFYFKEHIENAGVKTEDVKNLVIGAYKKPYFSKIVSGQLDVDRLDYLLRDSLYAGVSYGLYDLGRIIDQLAVIDDKFVVLEGGYEAVEQLIFARYQMYQQVYFHKTKRGFELMLQKCGQILKDQGLLDIPTLKDLKIEEGQEEFLKRDDRWFQNKIYANDNPPDVKVIADMIKNRKHYFETYSLSTYRHPSDSQDPGPNDSIGELKQVHKSLNNNLTNMGIQEHEFLIDSIERAPYNLVPDYQIESKAENKETKAIRIFYKNNRFSEPIEKRSHIVHTFGMHRPVILRGFVIPEKYNLVRDYLKTIAYHIPKREI